MATEFSNSSEVIDSRDVIDRIASLREDIADMSDDTSALADSDELQELRDELATLEALADEASQYAADWEYGETLIRDSYFVEYAQQLAEDIGAINTDAGWPNSYIDWERAAEALQIDYTSVDYDGVIYWIR